MSAQPAVQTFMELASGLLLSQQLVGSSRPELIRMARTCGLSEEGMDSVIVDLMHRGIVVADPSFFHGSDQDGSEQDGSEEDPNHTPNGDAPDEPIDLQGVPQPVELRLDDTNSSGVPLDRLQEDMFRRHVAAAMRDARATALEPAMHDQLVRAARNFGLTMEDAETLLVRWGLAEVPQGNSLAPPMPPMPSDSSPSAAGATPPPLPLPSNAPVSLSQQAQPPAALESVRAAPPPLPPTALPPTAPIPPRTSPLPPAPTPGPPPVPPPFAGQSVEAVEPHPPHAAAPPPEPLSSAPEPEPSTTAAPPSPAPPLASDSDRAAPPPVNPPSPDSAMAAPAPVQPPTQPPNPTQAVQRAQRTPEESYVRYLTKAIPQLKRKHISVRSEEKLVEQGVEKLGLGAPFARQLLCRYADQIEMPMLSRQAIEENTRFDEFRRRADEVIAEHRGVNAKSRMMLAALGEELGLDDEELDQALSQLTGASSDDVEQDKRDSFRERVAGRLEGIQSGVITAPMQESLLRDGVQLEGLAESQAEGVLRAAAAAAKIRIIDRRQAKRHVLGLITKVREADAQGDLSAAQEQAEQWGLGEDEFCQLVDQYHDERARAQRGQRRMAQVAAGLGAVVLVLAAGLTWHFVSGPAEADPSETGVVEGGSPAEPAPPVVDKPPTTNPWADADVQVAVANLRKLSGAERVAFVSGSIDEAESTRRSAWMSLCEDFPAMASNDEQLGAFSALFQNWCRLETSDDLVREVSNRLLEYLPSRGDTLPAQVDAYQVAFKTMSLLLEAAAGDTTPEARSLEIAELTGIHIEASLDPAMPPDALKVAGKSALAVIMFENLVQSAQASAGSGADAGGAGELPSLEPHHWQLSVALDGLLGSSAPNRVDDLQLSFLTAALRDGREPWQPYDELVRKLIESRRPAALLRMAKLMEDTSDPELQAELARQLQLSLGDSSASRSAREVAALVRASHANGTPVGPPDERRLAALGTLTSLLADPPGDRRIQASAAREICRYTQGATLGCLAIVGPRAKEAFARLREAPAPKFSDSAKLRPGSRAGVWKYSQVISKQTAQLKKTTRVSMRAAIIASICKIAQSSNRSQLESPSPEQAALIAKELLKVRQPPEVEALKTHGKNLVDWPSLLLALSDELAGATGRVKEIEETVFAIIGPVDFAAGEDWGTQLRVALVEKALRSMGGELNEIDQRSELVAIVGSRLGAMYAVQAEMRGAEVGNDSNASLKNLMRHAHGQLDRSKMNEADARWLDGLPQLISASESASDNGLHQFVYLQRAWLHLLGLEAVARGCDPSDVEKIESSLENLDRDASSSWEQIRDGERSLAKLWLLYLKEIG